MIQFDPIADLIAGLALIVSIFAIVLTVRRSPAVEWDKPVHQLVKTSNGDYEWTVSLTNRGVTTAEHVELYFRKTRLVSRTSLGEWGKVATDVVIGGTLDIAAENIIKLMSVETQRDWIAVHLRWRAVPRRRRWRYKTISLSPTTARNLLRH